MKNSGSKRSFRSCLEPDETIRVFLYLLKLTDFFLFKKEDKNSFFKRKKSVSGRLEVKEKP